MHIIARGPPSAYSPISRCSKRLADNAVEPLLEPLDGLVALDAVLVADAALHPAAAGDAVTGAGHAAVEVHAVDTDGGVVLDAEIDVLADTEAEVAGLAEVALAELILLDLEATLDDLLGLFFVLSVGCSSKRGLFKGVKTHLGATDGDVDGNLFVTADTEVTDGVAGLAWRARVSDQPETKQETWISHHLL